MRSCARFYCGVTLGAVFALLCPAPDPASLLAATVITVTNANDSGTGSLRDAINAANTSTPPVTIQFAIPPTNSATVKIISLSSYLPSLASSILIDGYTQPGASPNTLTNSDNATLLIQLDGSSSELYAYGLTITGTASTIRGLVITGFRDGGILVEGSTNVIEGNFIGTDSTGTNALGNDGGVIVGGDFNTIGGTNAAARNVISGNYSDGIDLYGTSNVIAGNFIGTDTSGANALGNLGDGVRVDEEDPFDTIGGTNAGARNIVSANSNNGIHLSGNNITVQGNFIGTDATGTYALGNGGTGVLVDGSGFSNTVGGASSGAGNLISGNDSDGVDIYGDNNTVQGNFIGTDVTGTDVIGNGGDGVYVSANNNTISNNVISGNGNGIDLDGAGGSADFNAAQGNRIGTDVTGARILSNYLSGIVVNGPGGDGGGEASSNTVGGAALNQGNIIAGSGSNGVMIVGAGATGNAILGNSIFSNTGLGIDLGGDGVTANDACDPDVGPNRLQNFPVLQLAAASGSSLTVSGSLNSVGSTLYRLEFFANSACSPSGYGEGETFIGATNVTTQPSTNCSVGFGVGFPVSGLTTNDLITATATDPFGNTSEFSPCLRVTSANHPPVAFCRNVTVTADANCQASVTASQVDNGSYDPDGDPITLSLSPAGPYAVGARSVTLIVVDSFGASNTCSATITVVDQTPPTITCPPTKTVNADAGKCSAANVNLGTPTVSDNCGVVSVSSNAPASFPVGTNTVTWTVTDVHGNTNTCQQLVIVLDNQPPTITCPPTKTVNADAGKCSAANINLGAPTVSDNCGVASVTSNALASFPVGTNTVTWTAADVHGNTNTCQQLVIVIDNQPPTITCPPTKTVNADLGQCSASNVNLGAPSVSNNCGVASITSNAPSSFPVGTNTVTWTVTNVHGNTNSCQQLVIVINNQSPSITCPAPVTVACASAVPAPDPSSVTAGGNCGTATVSFVSDVITNQICANRFTVIRTYRATDSAGNNSTCQQIITVNNTSAPLITGSPSNLTVECSSQVPAADDAAVSATDNCGGTVTITHDADVISNQSCSNQYTITRTYHATDTCGNSASVTQTVTVHDTTPPTITCPAEVTTNMDVGQCSASIVVLASPAVSDDCGGDVTVTNDAPSALPKGTNVVVWTATDACGNSSTCTQDVIVIDNEPPTITCPASITVTGTLGRASNPVTFVTPTATDNCSTNVLVVCVPASGASFPYGTNNVTCTAVDSSGNSNSCVFSVTVIPPAGPDLTGFWLATTAFHLNRNNYIFGAFQVINQGTELASNSLLRVYRSTNSSSTNSTVAHVVKTFHIPQLDAGRTNPPSLCGIKLPRGVSSTNQFLIAVVDASKKVLEADEGNNMISVQPTNFVPSAAALGSFMETVHRAKGH